MNRSLRELAPQLPAAVREQPLDVIVIGGGQAGLSVGYHLARRGLRFVILDESQRIGDSWRQRWDSLKLFTPARFDALDGLPFPLAPNDFPTRQQMADYLENYAARFRLPVQNGVRVESLTRRGARYVVKARGVELEAAQVVVAMSNYQVPRLPELAGQLRPDIVQLHSSAYRNPDQLREGATLIVGAGNSGAEIGLELASLGRKVWLAGRDTGQVPFRMRSFWGRWLLGPLLLRFVFHRLLTIATPMGRQLRAKPHGGTPLIRTWRDDLSQVGVERCPRVEGTRAGLPAFEDGTTLEVSNVIWCTGYHPGFSWIDLPIFDEQRLPQHVAGAVPAAPGLYFVGLHFLYAMSSTMIHGVGRDASRVAHAIAQRVAARSAQSAECP